MLFSVRATSILCAAARAAKGRTVLLPGLYCVEVAKAIERAQVPYRCYDVPESLEAAGPEIEEALAPDVGAVVVLHPFGLARPPKLSRWPKGVTVIEDACHAARSARLGASIGQVGSLVVYSPRKELAWEYGGVAEGRYADPLAAWLESSGVVERRWRCLNWAPLLDEGRAATERVVDRLGEFLPRVTTREILTALPLKSRYRDHAIERLQRDGMGAWRWRGSLRGADTERTPRAIRLRDELFLVPLRGLASVESLLRSLARVALERWD